MITAYDYPARAWPTQPAATSSSSATPSAWSFSAIPTRSASPWTTCSTTRAPPSRGVAARARRRRHAVSLVPRVGRGVGPQRRALHPGRRARGESRRRQAVAHPRDRGDPRCGDPGDGPHRTHAAIGQRPRRIQAAGQNLDDAQRLVDEAHALDQAGCFAIVLECVPARARGDDHRARVGPDHRHRRRPACDGQVLVFHDLLGLYDGHTPKFVRRYANIADEMRTAIEHYLADVRDGSFPDDAKESFHARERGRSARAVRRRERGRSARIVPQPRSRRRRAR